MSRKEKPVRRSTKPSGQGAREKAARTSSTAARLSHIYRQVTLCIVIEAAHELSAGLEGPVPRRKLRNHLRGSEPPPDLPEGRGGTSYGLLEAFPASWLDSAIEALLDEGHLEQDPNSPSRVVPMTEPTLAWLRAETPALPFPRRPRLGEHLEEEEALRALRRKIADEEDRAAYGVFPNSTLAAVAAYKPQSLAELALIPGLGEARIRRYGRRILRALR